MRAIRAPHLLTVATVLLAGAVASPLAAADPAVFAKEGKAIVLWTGEGSPAVTLPAPPAVSNLRREPLPLVEDGRLAGLVWLEGDAARALAVRYARWNGAAWEAPQTVAAPGPGSQLALSAARLKDGSWLLAWSAFDGHDDEIVWSRQAADGSWSVPQRVAADNDVPDITPALTATADGSALLAWSRFDPETGGYQVVTSRFQARGWAAPRVAAAASGSLFPSFEAAESGAWLLLYQTALPRGWAAVEIDGAGRTGRTAAIRMGTEAARRERPEVAADRSGVTFRWPALGGQPGAERAADWMRP